MEEEANQQLQTAEKELPQDQQVRKSYIEALGISLGGSPLAAKLTAEALLGNPALAEGGFYTKDARTLDDNQRKNIETIGLMLLTGSLQSEQLKFTVGARALSLLKENIDSGFFTNLEQWIGYWTDGKGNEIFKSITGSST